MHDAKAAWITWFVGFLLLAAGWALVTPVNGYPDEVDHAYLAVGFVHGQVFPHIGAYNHGTGAITNVPASFRNARSKKPCGGIRSITHCQSAGPHHPGFDTVVSAEGRNFPLYYALVGWPSLAFPDQMGWYLMRLASAVLCSALLAAGAVVLMSMRRRPLVLASGLFLGLTPLALNLAGSVNPSGLEIASAACFWVVVLALMHDSPAIPLKLLVALGAVSGTLLATCRILGGAWVLLAVLLSLTTVGPAKRGRFLRARSSHVVLGSAAIAVAVMTAWTLAFRSYQTFRHPKPGAGLVDAVRAGLGNQARLLQQMLAYLGWLTRPPPVVAEVCWALAVLAFVAIVVVSNRRARKAILIGCALALALPFAVIVATYHAHGVAWQGRYTLPLAVGLPLLAVVPPRPRVAEPRGVVGLAAAVVLLVFWGQFAVFENAWASGGHPRHWYVLLGLVFVVSGAVVLITTVARADLRSQREARGRRGEIDAPREPPEPSPTPV